MFQRTQVRHQEREKTTQRMKEKNFQIIYMRLVYKIYKELEHYNSITSKHNFKWAMDLKKHFSKI